MARKRKERSGDNVGDYRHWRKSSKKALSDEVIYLINEHLTLINKKTSLLKECVK